MSRSRIPSLCQNPLCHNSFFPLRTKSGYTRFCCRTCIYFDRARRTIDDRFWEKVLVCPHGRECVYCCWEWQAQRNRAGYGDIRIEIDGRWASTKAHRVSWELLNKQQIPKGLFGLHYCDNPPCCNAMHIFVGTRKDNTHDAMRKGRLVKPPLMRGSHHPKAVLTEADIPDIRNLRRQGLTGRQIAAELGFALHLVKQVLSRRTWGHIP